VTFASSDPHPAVLPPDYTFKPGDNGTHTYEGVTFFTAGAQSLSVQDTANGSHTGAASVVVAPALANHFLITAPPTAISGVPFGMTLTALDPYGNVDTNYAGTVAFATSDSDPGVNLPADYTFQSSDGGAHIFTAGVTLLTMGDQTVTAIDTADSTISGSVTVSVGGGPAAPPGGGRRSTPGAFGLPTGLVDELFISLHNQESGFMPSKHNYLFPRFGGSSV
jgi:hypothetical protein